MSIGISYLIYNVDEKGINTGGGKPPHIVTSRNKIAQVVTPERSQTVTVLGCGNAAGSNILPYLVFPGKRMLPDGVRHTVEELAEMNHETEHT
jgi:hypothetical protein